MSTTPATVTKTSLLQEVKTLIENYDKIPDKLPDFPNPRSPALYDPENNHHKLRDNWINRGMFAFVSWKWVNPFSEWIGKRKVLEVMAGAGWLAKALREKGIDIIATDDHSWSKLQKWGDVTEVKELKALEAIEKYGRKVDIMIMSWPYMDKNAYKAIKKLHEVNPQALVVYIGEGNGGCTADSNFFESFFPVADEEFESKVANEFEAWPYIHDQMQLGKYQPPPLDHDE